MKVKITHHYSEDKGKTWKTQFQIFDNVYKIESEYQPQNGNSNWLVIYQDNGVIKTHEYIEFEQNLKNYCFDILEVKECH